MKAASYKLKTASGISPAEAGYGLVHADTVIATITDKLYITPDSLKFEISTGGKAASQDIAELGLSPGVYAAVLKVWDDNGAVDEKEIQIILAEPARIRRRFGARVGSLGYDKPVVVSKSGKTAPWSSLWKTGSVSDIVVDFADGHKFVFWKGMSYAPSWAFDKSMTSLFFAETVEPGVFRDCCEMMSDRECRYSHVRLVQNTPARVIVHWRCALSDPEYNIARDQWADEIFYIYPDGTICRNVTIYIDPTDDSAWKTCPQTGKRVPADMINTQPGQRAFNDMEFINVNPMGSSSEDHMPPEALTVLDCRDFKKTFKWPKPEKGAVPTGIDGHIYRMNYLHRPGIFVASGSEGMLMSLQDNVGVVYEAGADIKDDMWRTVDELPTLFANFIHWPLTRGHGTTVLTDKKYFDDRPTHTFLGHAVNNPFEVGADGAATWVWLTGVAPESDDELRTKVKAWLHPANIKGAVYDPMQRAYVIEKAPGSNVELEADVDIILPTFIIKGNDDSSVTVYENDRTLNHADFAAGTEHYIDHSQVVITFTRNIPKGSKVNFKFQS